MAQIISGGDLILEVLKRTGIISHSVQGLLNWRNNVIWLLLCLSILDNYLSLHLQMLRFLSLLCFVFYNQTGICLLCILNRRQTNVYKPGAVQNGVLCEVDITTPELVTCYQNNRTIIYQSYSIWYPCLISTANLKRHFYELLTDKAVCIVLTYNSIGVGSVQTGMCFNSNVSCCHSQ